MYTNNKMAKKTSSTTPAPVSAPAPVAAPAKTSSPAPKAEKAPKTPKTETPVAAPAPVASTDAHTEGSALETDRKSTRLNSSHTDISRMPSSA